MRYPQIHDGEWVTPIRKGYKMICCGCGLKHDMTFRINKLGQIQFKSTRIN